MRSLLTGQSIAVRYKDQDFDQIISRLRQEPTAAQATLLAFTGMPKLLMEMAAKELAATLGKTLYRIDLQAVSNKYIGETEKNLEQLFARAAVAGWILFFDEADALFGGRTNIHDAHDRYGITETNYLQEMLSRHRGIVIALFKSSSEAERRRDRVRQLVVRFPPL
jgi:SpoVK/Ycf46/Vps4 family AAA+-type ATPase